jgi:hypothetical protein
MARTLPMSTARSDTRSRETRMNDRETQALETIRALQPAADAYERAMRPDVGQPRISDEEMAGQLTLDQDDEEAA